MTTRKMQHREVAKPTFVRDEKIIVVTRRYEYHQSPIANNHQLHISETCRLNTSASSRHGAYPHHLPIRYSSDSA